MSEHDNSKSHESTVITAVKHLPQLFAVLVALAYGTGFLCIFTFLDRFGIRGTGEDIFRIKYIHVGILFLLLPLTILTPLALAISLRRTAKKEEAKKCSSEDTPKTPNSQSLSRPHFDIPISSLILFVNMFTVFYIFTLFTPREFAFSKMPFFPLVFLLTMLGPKAIDKFTETQIQTDKEPKWRLALRYCLVGLILIVLDGLCFYGFFHELFWIFYGSHWYPFGAIYYLLFMVLIVVTIILTNSKANTAPNVRSRREIYLSGLAIICMFYFLGIVAFALTVYPHIPVAKGGGNYLDSPRIRMRFRGDSNTNGGDKGQVRAWLESTNEFVIIERTLNSIFVAGIADTNAPLNWREMRVLPDITEVNPSSVDYIIFKQPPTNSLVNATNGPRFRTIFSR